MKRCYAIAAVTLACALPMGCASPKPAAPVVTVEAARVDAAVAPFVGSQMPGLVVAVGYGGRLIFEKGYGKADLATGARMTPQTPLEIGSMTKEMTSGVLLTLARDRRLAIDNHVSVLLPQYKYGNRMTLRELSTMSSGLQGASVDGDATFGVVNPGTHLTVPEIYQRLNATPPIRPPNAVFDYANVGYWLLGRTIEAATSTPYARTMQVRMFGPLHMKTAYIRTLTTRDPNVAKGYTRFSDGSFHRCSDLDVPSSDAAGMAVMTAGDVVTWDEAIRAHRFVQGELADAMFKTSGVSMGKDAPPGVGYAMGWFVAKDGVRFHGGDTQLFASWNAMFPDGVDVVMLSNAALSRFTFDRDELAYAVHNTVAGVAPLSAPHFARKYFAVTSCPK